MESEETEIQACIRENPGRAIIMGVGAGIVLAQLPLRWIAASGLRLALWAIKPALIGYGLFRMAEDCHEGRCPWRGIK